MNQVVGEALSGKTVIDVTNALDASMNLAVGFTTSGAEELQKKLPRSRVVKAFNTVFSQHMDTGKLGDQRLTAFAIISELTLRALAFAGFKARCRKLRSDRAPGCNLRKG